MRKREAKIFRIWLIKVNKKRTIIPESIKAESSS